VYRDVVVGERRGRLGRGEVERLGVLHHAGRGDEHGHVALRLARQVLVGVPVRRVLGVGPAERGAHTAGPTVEAGQGEVPVAELVVQVAQVPGGRPGGLFRVAPLVDPRVHGKAVPPAGAGHELPHAHGAGPAPGVGVEAALDHGEVLQLLRHALLRQNVLDHGPVHLHTPPPVVDVLAGLLLEGGRALLHQPVRGHRNLGPLHLGLRTDGGALQERIFDVLQLREQAGPDGENLPPGQERRVRVAGVAVEAPVLGREPPVDRPDSTPFEGVRPGAEQGGQLRHGLVEEVGPARTVVRGQELRLQGVQACHLRVEGGGVRVRHQDRILGHPLRLGRRGERRERAAAAGEHEQGEAGAAAAEEGTGENGRHGGEDGTREQRKGPRAE